MNTHVTEMVFAEFSNLGPAHFGLLLLLVLVCLAVIRLLDEHLPSLVNRWFKPVQQAVLDGASSKNIKEAKRD